MKTFLYFLIFITIYSYRVSATTDQLPDGIPTCKQNDENLNQCLKNLFQSMIPQLKNGSKELNIPPIDPFHLGNDTYKYSEGVVYGRISIKNANIFGLSETIVQEVDASLNEGRMRYTLLSPKLVVEGLYDGDVRFNKLRFLPKGYFNISITDTLSKVSIKFEPYDKDGVRFLKASDLEFSPEIGDFKIYATGIFTDQALNKIALEFLNRSWREILDFVVPVTRDYYKPLVIAIVNGFLKNFSVDVLLPKV